MKMSLLTASVLVVLSIGLMADEPSRQAARDYSADKDFIAFYREAALDIGRRKMKEIDEHVKANPTVVPTGRRLAPGGHFTGFFLWDAAFAVLWARYADPETFPYCSTLDNFYALATPTGFIPREYTAKGEPCWTEAHPISFASPILSWAEVILYREKRTDLKRLERVYGPLVRHHAACRRSFRRADGLYFGDQLGCGMDDIKRWPKDMTPDQRAEGGILFSREGVGAAVVDDWWDKWLVNNVKNWSWNRQAGWIDMSSQMALDCLCLAEIADALGKADDAKAYRAEHAEIARAVNEKCWDEERGFYFDCYDKGIIDRYLAAAFWTLVAKIPSHERAERMVKVLFDPDIFGRPVMMPSIGACEPDYEPETGYWRGACWPPTTYVTIIGLRDYGFVKEANEVARRWYNANAELYMREKTIFENLSPEQCVMPKMWSGRDFCGWSALAPVAVPYDLGWVK